METLNEVKTSSSQIDLSLQESTEIKRKLIGEYEQYKDVCSRAASLYVEINHIYSMPVNVFMSLYVKSISLEKVRIRMSTFSDSIRDLFLNYFQEFVQRRIFEQVVKSTYNMISRALPKDEHFALALHILKGAHPESVPGKVFHSVFYRLSFTFTIFNTRLCIGI